MATNDEGRFVVWYKDYTGQWVKHRSRKPFKSMRSAEWGLKYVQSKFALNGQAGIFKTQQSIRNDLQAVMYQLG